MSFACLKCKSLLKDWIGSKPNVVLPEEQPGEVDRFRYLDNYISPGGRIPEVSCRIQKAQLAFTNLNQP